MKIIYDRDVDAMTIIFHETTVTTKELDAGIFLDYDKDGHLAGIEILDASERLGGADPMKEASLVGIALRKSR